jgi:arginine repressor
MRLPYCGRSLRKVTLLSAVLLMAATPGAADAQAYMLPAIINVQIPQTLLAMAGANNLCVAITYDQNGNRLTQTVTSTTINATVWGAGTYGCFLWNQ